MFTPSEREKILKHLLTVYKKDDRITGIILVGSGAIGFTDEYSDIDIVAVVDPHYSTQVVFQEWVQRISEELPVIHRFEVSHNEQSFLAGFLLSGCLEIDFGVVSIDELIARKGRWQVLYDRTQELETKLQKSWEARERDNPQAMGKRLASVWHYIIQAVVSVQRKQLWRALHNLEEIRNRSLRLAGLRHGLVVSHYRQIDELPQNELKAYEQTIAQAVTASEIMRALQVAVQCFFRELLVIEQGTDNAKVTEKIAAEMACLLEEFSEQAN